jgi:hypothetical protein
MQINGAKAEIEQLANAGVPVELVVEGAQPYVLVRQLETPMPPWDSAVKDILIPVPLAYDLGTGLDGFYIALPYRFQDGEHNRVNGQVVKASGREWRGVSWHYPDAKQFRPGVDNVESHIVHCRGFFLHRGAVNARN